MEVLLDIFIYATVLSKYDWIFEMLHLWRKKNNNMVKLVLFFLILLNGFAEFGHSANNKKAKMKFRKSDLFYMLKQHVLSIFLLHFTPAIDWFSNMIVNNSYTLRDNITSSCNWVQKKITQNSRTHLPYACMFYMECVKLQMQVQVCVHKRASKIYRLRWNATIESKYEMKRQESRK